MPRSAAALLGAFAIVLLDGCGCGDPRMGPGGDGGPDGAYDAPVRDGDGTCDPVTGELCPCPAEGDTRSCRTGAVGACGMGTQRCETLFEFPTWGVCGDAPEPTDELCDGLDNDCDAMTDEALDDLSCGDGICRTTGPSCASGVPQTCVPGRPTDEGCDGLDNDCDAMTDEALGDLACGTGACARSVPACEGGVAGACVPGAPSDEACDGGDDDCDGLTDEGLGTTTCGVGECEVTVDACTAGVPSVCTPGMAGTEICDGLDNDCNGTVDDGFGTTVCGVGECRRVVLDCAGGGGGTCVPGTPAPEDCDGRDDDCDGMTDEGIADVSCGVGACARSGPGCISGTPGTCTPGTPGAEACDAADNDCDGRTDEGFGTLSCGTGACARSVPACSGGVPGRCIPGMPATEICGDGIDQDCDGTPDDGCACDMTVDADFDGFNECVDCDDHDGAVYPGRAEICNGADEDCDGEVDEDFDRDGDGFATCTTDPLLRDCDDTRAFVYPGAPERCGPAGTGDGIDDDCDGYVDDGCMPCDPIDRDGDGVSECMGDCDDSDVRVAPTLPERCDGLDTDCNVFTTENCDVSERCNWASGADACRDDLLCGCVVTTGGTCTGTYICTSFCEGSFTGPLGAGCTATQTCLYRVTLTDNLHGCAESTATIGTRDSGAVCTDDGQCRSGRCERLCVGPGCTERRCADFCDHHEPDADGSCATGTACTIVRASIPAPGMFAVCGLPTGTGLTGARCSGTGSTPCTWGSSSCVSGICAEPCGLERHCPGATHCSFLGSSVAVGSWGATAPPYVTGMPAAETVPVCLADTGAGLHDRRAGAACTRNGDCAGQFCDRSLRVCVEPCTTDASCPTGLTCELQYVRVPTGVFSARVCVGSAVDALLEAM